MQHIIYFNDFTSGLNSTKISDSDKWIYIFSSQNDDNACTIYQNNNEININPEIENNLQTNHELMIPVSERSVPINLAKLLILNTEETNSIQQNQNINNSLEEITNEVFSRKSKNQKSKKIIKIKQKYDFKY